MISARLLDRMVPEPNSGCWLWTGTLDRDGYGRITEGSGSGKRKRSAHRLAYECVHGVIPPGMTLDHKCRVRCCINPDHLEAVPNRVNVLRGDGISARKAKQTHCKRGHPLFGENVFRRQGVRHCRICTRIRQAESRQRVRDRRAMPPDPVGDAPEQSGPALIERARVAEWQPIETAPKDRTRILLATDSGHVTVGHWLDNSQTQWPWQGWSTDRGPFVFSAVTHWMPLPAPPAGVLPKESEHG